MIDRRQTDEILSDPATPDWIKGMMNDRHPFLEFVADRRRQYRRACRRQHLRVALRLAFILVASVGLWWLIVAAINAWIAPFLWATPI
jgi:hypothetical protein